jgi:hypothetical protein
METTLGSREADEIGREPPRKTFRYPTPFMRIVEFSMRTFSWLGAAALMGCLLAPPALAQTNRFDGNWSVEVVTQQGACDRAYRYAVIIQNGHARYGGPEQFNVNGRVQSNGTVSASISRGQDRANVRGRLSGNSGSGTWSTSGGRVCSGNWNAEKRG